MHTEPVLKMLDIVPDSGKSGFFRDGSYLLVGSKQQPFRLLDPDVAQQILEAEAGRLLYYMRKVVYTQVLSVGYLAQGQLSGIVIVHVVSYPVEPSCQDFISLVLHLVLETTVFHDEILEVRQKAGYQIMSALYDLMLISVSFLDDLHHDLCQEVSQHLQTFIAVILHISDKEIILQTIVIPGKIREIHLKHHHQIVLVGPLETMHFPVIQNENIALLEIIGIISVPKDDASFQNIHNFHIVMEMYGILFYVGSYYIDRQLIFVNNFFFKHFSSTFALCFMSTCVRFFLDIFQQPNNF